jgi:WXG100 family type VII secretion target
MNPSTPGLLVDHAALDRITADLRDAVGGIDARLDRLEAELSPLRSEWGGQASDAYVVARTAWDRAILEMRQLLADASTAVAESNAGYARTDRASASTFEQL